MRCTVFLCVLCLALSSMGRVTGTKNQEMLSDYYFAEKKGSHDIIFLGPSTIMNGVYPLNLWHEFGFTAYNLGSGNQAPFESYYLAREVIERDHPRLIVCDLGKIRRKEGIGDIGFLHYITDRMPSAMLNRLRLIRYAAVTDEYVFDDVAGLVAPLYLYHSRWEELKEADFTESYKRISMGAKVSTVRMKRKVQAFASYEPNPEAALSEPMERELKKLITLCQETGTELLLVTMPNPNVAKYVSQADYERRVDAAFAVQQIADAYGVPHLNLMEESDAIGIVAKEDTADGQHLNISGATKFTSWIGAYIRDHFEVEDRRGDEKYRYLDGRYEEFQAYIDERMAG